MSQNSKGKLIAKKPIGPAKNSIKAQATKRRQVFRPILETPYTDVEWPRIEPETLRNLLELFIRALATYKDVESVQSVMTTGFNSTMKALEDRKKTKPENRISIVFVCKADVKPPLLVQHLPVLAAVASIESDPVKLVQLPHGSSAKISQVLGIKDTWIVGIPRVLTMELNSEFQVLQDFVFESVEDVLVPWLQAEPEYEKAKVKFISTTQPIVTKNNQKGKISKT
ncbi:unnamed protein product [Kuraishia capsulata CBS 1993]|uniref:Uncharacterized protein n=1 Tax=Kuraishia capsulata CBS 1993 TaxID=1382522 RepID=W6MN98_9ASCO|nr:uncharacterized protein KUCA_T00002464001 [Kuraishia capsulata CBS 1993]CDK26492.1 unnamed protein product [Kuraishia capsulata CBS 1993]